jgi:hypothetical protein
MHTRHFGLDFDNDGGVYDGDEMPVKVTFVDDAWHKSCSHNFATIVRLFDDMGVVQGSVSGRHFLTITAHLPCHVLVALV